MQIYKNTWDYWWDQHKEHRIKGPFHYYLPILLLYELPVLLIVVCSWWRALAGNRKTRWIHLGAFIGPQVLLFVFWFLLGFHMPEKYSWDWADKKLHITSVAHLHFGLLYIQLLTHVTGLLFARGRRVEAFLTFWSVTALFAYSYAGEKVPWLTIHIAAPLMLLAGMAVDRWARRVQWSNTRRWAVAAAVFLVALYQVRAQAFVAFINTTSPAERIVFNHTSPDLNYVVKRVEEIGHRTSLGEKLPILVPDKTEVLWPLYWNLRHLPITSFTPTDDFVDTTSRPVVIVNWDIAMSTPNIRMNYDLERLKVREWWEPPMLDFGALSDFYLMLSTEESRRPEAAGYVRWQRCVIEWRKLWRYVAYREIWSDSKLSNPGAANSIELDSSFGNSGQDFALGVRKDLDQMYLTPEVLDRLPRRPDVPRSL